jgi:mRNA interferase HigB
MRIISRKPLREFGEQHADAVTPLDDWSSIVRMKEYHTPAEVKADLASVSFISADVTVFYIGGNKYRLSVSIRYQHGIVYIRRVMTHEEYDRRTEDGTL